MGLLVSGQNPAAIKTAERNIFTATAGQTSFTITQGYQPGDIDVYLNGIRLVDTEDYIALNGSTVVLNEAATVGDSVVVVCFYPFNVASHYTKSESDTRYVNAGGDTMTGALALPSGGLTVGTDQLIVDSSGRVRMPYQPAFLAQAINNDTDYGVNTVIPWPNVINNRGNCYSSSTNRFTAPIAGSYFFAFQVWHNTAAVVRVGIRVNGTLVGNGSNYIHARLSSTAVNETSTLTAVLSLNVNDYVDVFNAEGTARLFYANHFTGFFIG